MSARDEAVEMIRRICPAHLSADVYGQILAEKFNTYRAEVLAEAAALADPKKPEVSFFGQYGPQVAWWLRMLVGRKEATAPAATATPNFFQVDHVYAREHHGRTIEFHVIHVATAPDCGFPTAFGWRKDPEFDVMLPMDSDDFHTGWTDVTEAGGSR